MIKHYSFFIWLTGIAILTIAAGCRKKSPPSASANPAPEVMAARQLFDQNCAKCHAVAGAPAVAAEGGKGGRNKGPDLTRVAADPAHSADWIAAHIRNPKAHKSESRMPAFEGKLQPAEIKALAEYLAAMKG